MAIGEVALTKLAESGAEKAADGSVSAFGALMRKVRQWNAEAGILLGDAFRRYLDKAYKRYNQVTTLATGIQTRCIFGSDSIYVKIGVAKRKKPYYNAPFDTPRSFSAEDVDVISTETADTLLSAVPNGRSRNILILGTGGAGKSMLMRYLFLKTVLDGSYVPVMLELRKISAMEPGSVSLEKLIYAAMESFDTEVKPEHFGYSLRQGKYLFLLDGLDEVKESMFVETIRAIEDFLKKYPENACVMTSRPKPGFVTPEIFTVVESMPLDVEQAAELAGKLWEKDEKTVEFCRQLKDGLFEKHESFAENPLLLSMLFLTFMRNSSLPEHLAEFYEKAYEALYSAHDTNNKGYYARDFKSGLNESQFKTVFARFCFQTLFKEEYSFTEAEILDELQKSLRKLGFHETFPTDYLFDLRRAVCMIVKEGLTYRFSHRSFQTYFAAYYTASMPDERQKQWFDKILYFPIRYISKFNYYELLFQIEPERFGVNALEKGLRSIQREVDNATEADVKFLELISTGKNQAYRTTIPMAYLEEISLLCRYKVNYSQWRPVSLFQIHFMKIRHLLYRFPVSKSMESSLFEMVQEDVFHYMNQFIDYEQVRHFKGLTEDERYSLYQILISGFCIPETRAAIDEWLAELDRKRQSAPTDSLEDF